ASDAARVVVATGEQAGAGRRAQRRGVEVRVAQAVPREPVEVGGFDVRAEAAELRVADVVEHDEQDVRRACPRSRLVRPPRLRLPVVPPDPPFELARFHGLQHGAKWFVRAARSRYDGDAARAKGVPSAWTSRSDARTGSCQCIHLAPKACTTLPSNTTPAASA